LWNCLNSATPLIPEEKKKEKKSRLLKSLRSKKEGKKEDPSPRSEPEICYPDILNLIRAQLEASLLLQCFNFFIYFLFLYWGLGWVGVISAMISATLTLIFFFFNFARYQRQWMD
jgi:hypothetical protein